MRRTGFLAVALAILLVIGVVWRHRKTEPHSVTLTWQAVLSHRGTTVIGYNVYRRSSEGGSFVRIAERVPGPPYKDLLVSSGRTYFYVVTSVDQVGRESRYSDEIQADVR